MWGIRYNQSILQAYIVAYIHRENDVSTLRSGVMVCILFLFATFAVATRGIDCDKAEYSRVVVLPK